ncbi:threonine/serine exporter family protein [Virgibacillus halodenitrificans]|uniref:threonine/serine exporter family protein n=1 Tax=Virgibacillus halodenitrificans TaxID=1482 RepID=UPI000EF54256|nr:threonine/serine exporter family protein [Virgibacillus halodenitrificans]WHX26046.1 threonine/serine exporter family protein [Virgibacillus halodenitrificans]
MKEKVAVAKVCMLAGKIMLECGAETYRVEDTMNRIAAAFGLHDAQSYATPTGINFSMDSSEATHFRRISHRATDLHKIAEVNSISRRITAGELTVYEANLLLNNVSEAKLAFPYWLQIIAAAFVSGSFTIMFGGSWPDFLPSFIAGGLGFAAMLGAEKIVEIRFIAEFFASLIIGLASILFITQGVGIDLDKIIIGAVMPLVPGLHITNAVRDLMAGHLVAGLSKGAEAILTSFAIGAGVAVVLAFV